MKSEKKIGARIERAAFKKYLKTAENSGLTVIKIKDALAWVSERKYRYKKGKAAYNVYSGSSYALARSAVYL